MSISFRFVAILLASLSMAMAFSHLLQLPPRMDFDAATWIMTQGLFELYGSVGAFIEVGAVVLAGVLAYLVRGRRPASYWALSGALLLGAALVIWLTLVAPVNMEIMNWTPDSVPADWARWRAQWEYAHAARAVLLIIGFVCLLQSALASQSTRRSRHSK